MLLMAQATQVYFHLRRCRLECKWGKEIIFLISRPKQMLRAFKRTISMTQLFQLMDKIIMAILPSIHLLITTCVLGLQVYFHLRCRLEYREGIDFFLISQSEYMLWVLKRTVSMNIQNIFLD